MPNLNYPLLYYLNHLNAYEKRSSFGYDDLNLIKNLKLQDKMHAAFKDNMRIVLKLHINSLIF